MIMLGHVLSLNIHARGDTRGSRQVNDLSRMGSARHGGVHSFIFRKINSDNHPDFII